MKSSDAVKVCTVRGTNFEPAAAEGGSASGADAVDGAAAQDLSTFVSKEEVSSDRPSLQAATRVVAGGKGMKDGENFAMLDTMADKLGAAVGASRAAVDAGYVPNEYQIGQTGTFSGTKRRLPRACPFARPV